MTRGPHHTIVGDDLGGRYRWCMEHDADDDLESLSTLTGDEPPDDDPEIVAGMEKLRRIREAETEMPDEVFDPTLRRRGSSH